jgi:hypothetical protein
MIDELEDEKPPCRSMLFVDFIVTQAVRFFYQFIFFTSSTCDP